MPIAKEPVCQQLQELRKRLDRLKKSWDSPGPAESEGDWLSMFQRDWRERGLRIGAMLTDIDWKLNRSVPRIAWDGAQPEILRFPPT